MKIFQTIDAEQLKSLVSHAASLVVIMDEKGQVLAESKRLQEIAGATELPLSTFMIHADAFAKECQSSAGLHPCGDGTAYPEPDINRMLLGFFHDHAFAHILQSQPIGTRVVVFASRKVAECLDMLFECIGMTDEEAIAIVLDEPAHKVFCAACYHLNPTRSDTYIRCEACSRVLEVSTHYSKKHHAVMGYVALAEQMRDRQIHSQIETCHPEGKANPSGMTETHTL
jgi:hypothetical protein